MKVEVKVEVKTIRPLSSFLVLSIRFPKLRFEVQPIWRNVEKFKKYRKFGLEIKFKTKFVLLKFVSQ